MNIKLLKINAQEDLERRLNDVIRNIEPLQDNELFIRLINYDRQLLYGCTHCPGSRYNSVLNVSQSSNLSNRDELDFFEGISQLFHYYMWDDGELTIRWQKYVLEDGFVEASEGEEGAEPYLDYATDIDKVAREKDVLWLLDWHEKHHAEWIEIVKNDPVLAEEGEYDKEFINYN